ncbi:hypothetical protein GGR62_001650 [Xanthomonas campestris]|nr:hypothetical protein [Xanthomonas sp. 3075]
MPLGLAPSPHPNPSPASGRGARIRFACRSPQAGDGVFRNRPSSRARTQTGLTHRSIHLPSARAGGDPISRSIQLPLPTRRGTPYFSIDPAPFPTRRETPYFSIDPAPFPRARGKVPEGRMGALSPRLDQDSGMPGEGPARAMRRWCGHNVEAHLQVAVFDCRGRCHEQLLSMTLDRSSVLPPRAGEGARRADGGTIAATRPRQRHAGEGLSEQCAAGVAITSKRLFG